MMVRTYIFVKRSHLPGKGLRGLLTFTSIVVHVDDQRVEVVAWRSNTLIGHTRNRAAVPVAR